MFLYTHMCEIRIVGVALSGRSGYPVVVFESFRGGAFLPLVIDPYDAEIIIRDYAGEADCSAVSWLAAMLTDSPPQRAYVDANEEGRPVIRLDFSRFSRKMSRRLPVGEGLALVRRLGLPLRADRNLFAEGCDEVAFLTESRAFRDEFLYLTPVQFSPNIPME